MEIRDEHVEFEIVRRFRAMLDEQHPKYEASSTYALFAAILCWCTQRLRTDINKDRSIEARAAAAVWNRLRTEPITVEPWSIPVADDAVHYAKSISGRAFASSAFAEHTAERLIKNLRDAVAHGDARKVEPYHRPVRGRATTALVGFTFKCEERNRTETTWSGDITLLAKDMRRIASELSDRFCAAMEQVSNAGRLKEDASAGITENVASRAISA